MISFEVLGKPQGKARARMTKRGHTYTPQQTVLYENLIKLSYQQQANKHYDATTPLQMRIKAHYPIPQSWSNKKKEQALKGELKPLVKPDADNVIKVIADALNGLAYHDDKQLVKVEFEKVYSDIPKVVVEIQKKED